MKKLLLLVVLAAASLVGCKDDTPTVFRFEEYGYFVAFGADQKPAGVIAIEVAYTDVNGQTQTKTVTQSEVFSPMPPKKGTKMEFTSKMVLAPGQSKPTTGNEVKYRIAVGICGIKDGKSVAILDGKQHSESFTFSDAYVFLNRELDKPTIYTGQYTIEPLLEPGM